MITSSRCLRRRHFHSRLEVKEAKQKKPDISLLVKDQYLTQEHFNTSVIFVMFLSLLRKRADSLIVCVLFSFQRVNQLTASGAFNYIYFIWSYLHWFHLHSLGWHTSITIQLIVRTFCTDIMFDDRLDSKTVGCFFGRTFWECFCLCSYKIIYILLLTCLK